VDILMKAFLQNLMSRLMTALWLLFSLVIFEVLSVVMTMVVVMMTTTTTVMVMVTMVMVTMVTMVMKALEMNMQPLTPPLRQADGLPSLHTDRALSSPQNTHIFP
jgi:hypothetical protein